MKRTQFLLVPKKKAVDDTVIAPATTRRFGKWDLPRSSAGCPAVVTEPSHDSLLSSGGTARRGSGYVALENRVDVRGREEVLFIAFPSGRTA